MWTRAERKENQYLAEGQVVDHRVAGQAVVDQDEDLLFPRLDALLPPAIVGEDVKSKPSVLVAVDVVEELLLVAPQLDPLEHDSTENVIPHLLVSARSTGSLVEGM